MSKDNLISIKDLPCCPTVTKEPCCDRLQFSYRLEHSNDGKPVEVVIIAELERCPGPLALGDVVYSTTLLPGERVRLYTSSRNNRFSYDHAEEVNYRHEQASEETFYMASMDHFMSDLTVVDQGSSSSFDSSDFEVSTTTEHITPPFYKRKNHKVEGSFDAFSSASFVRELSRHAEASHHRSAVATRSTSSVAIGEVQSRTHAEGESESAYEASTRVIENKNQCHAVTYFAYQLVKRQTISFKIKAVLRHAVDQEANPVIDARPPRPSTGISVIPQGVLATRLDRLDVETVGRTSAAAQNANLIGNSGSATLSGVGAASIAAARPTVQFQNFATKSLTQDDRDAAVRAVDQELVKAGILDKNGEVTEKFRAEVEFERTTCLPTQAIVVKGCLDDCNVCEETLQEKIRLDLRRQDLENQLLERQIQLLENSQEYRCCPAGEVETEEPA